MATASIRRAIFAVFLFLLLLPISTQAAPLPHSSGAIASFANPSFANPSPLTEVAPLTFDGLPSVTVEIAKIRSGVLPGVLIGGHYEGVFKTRKQQYVATGQLEAQIEDSVRYLLEDELSLAGFPGLRSQAQSIFEELLDTTEPARFLIGGTITQVQRNSYHSLLGEYTRDDRNIRWELFDRDLNKVVYRQEITGSAQADGIDNPAATYEAIRASFRQLLADSRLTTILHPSGEGGEPPLPQAYTISAIAAQHHPLSVAQLVGRTLPSIVQIRTSGGQGSGFLLDASGLIVTNQHVVGSALSVKVRLYDGSTWNGRVLRRDASSDTALVKLAGDIRDISGLPICHTDVVRVGQPVVAIGNPLSLTNTVTQGIVSGFRHHASRRLIQTDTAINPGNSGGPLLNQEGTVIGIVTEKIVSEGVEGLGFALPIGEVLQRLHVTIDTPSLSPLDPCGNPRVAYR
jgi:hypothetical protein